jgi:lactoylglutathione lyase
VSDRPFKVLGIQQIAIGGLDKSKLSRLWVDTLGLTLTGNFRSERENVDEDIAAIGSGPFKVEVDLMQPIDPGKAPKVHEPQLNHIGLWIDNLAAAVEWLTGRGCASRPAVSARARPVTMFASCIPRATMPRRFPARAC